VEAKMRVLKLAKKSERWDLAAHVIVLAAVEQLENGRQKDGREKKAKRRRTKR
jgi:hypothetical protein